jgi:hypothetical protein
VRAWLLLPVVALCAIDVALTLAGQSREYWAGQYEFADEFNPVARPALSAGPMAFVALAACGLGFSAMIVLRGPPRAATWIAGGVALGHAIGGAGWLTRHGPLGWVAACLFLAAAAESSAACWRKANVT